MLPGVLSYAKARNYDTFRTKRQPAERLTVFFGCGGTLEPTSCLHIKCTPKNSNLCDHIPQACPRRGQLEEGN